MKEKILYLFFTFFLGFLEDVFTILTDKPVLRHNQSYTRGLLMSTEKHLHTVRRVYLPTKPNLNTRYILRKHRFNLERYMARVDRNIGWILKEEQHRLRKTKIAIAGCGGMGGLLASICMRLGIGYISITDPDVFDISNINRQMSAKISTIGVNKAWQTARDIRTIARDTNVSVDPWGIQGHTASTFLDGVDVVLDEIEFWAVGSRIQLHQTARKKGIPILNCNTVGFQTNILKFLPTSRPVEKTLGLTVEEALEAQEKIQSGEAGEELRRDIKQRVFDTFIPEGLPEYSADGHSTVDRVNGRLTIEGIASIVATNPPGASSFLMNRLLLELLEMFAFEKRSYVALPCAPGYISRDDWHCTYTVKENLS